AAASTAGVGRGGLVARPRHRRDAWTAANGSTIDATPATSVHGGSSATLASGTSAPIRTIVHIAVSRAHAGRPATVPTTASPVAMPTAPPTRATIAAAIAGATSGTIARLTRGEIRASRPNVTRTIGRVAACAASE